MFLLLPLACDVDRTPRVPVTEPAPTPQAPTASTAVRDPVAVLDRASLALRGVHATSEDAEAVRRDPDTLSDRVLAYTLDPRFGETIRDLHAEQLKLRWDVNPHPPTAGDLVTADTAAITRSVDEAPLRLIEAIVAGGRPYTEIVTAPTTMSDPILSVAYGLAWDPDGPEWQEVPWPDGRPAAGILADDNFFQRFQSAGINYHRSRANAVMSGLVCDDVSRREGLSLDVIDLSDPTTAVAQDPQCLACHAALDPVASAFWSARGHLQQKEINDAYQAGCPPELAYACYPLQFWDPSLDEREVLGLPAPSWYGTPVDDLGDLGRAVAADARFATCAAERFWSWFAQVPRDEVPFDLAAGLAEDFVAGGFDARALAVAVVTHPAFEGALTMRADAYARFVEDLTGYRWTGTPDGPVCVVGCVGEVDLARNNLYGNHTLLGGADGIFTFEATHTPTPMAFLSQEWLAVEAAAFVVDHDLLAAPEDRTFVAGPKVLTDAAIDATLADLQARVLGPLYEDEGTGNLRALFDGARERHPDDPGAAYRLVVTALLLDRRAVTY